MQTVAVIDYGMGNLHSVCKALAHAAPHTRITLARTAADIRKADRILLPGQGAIKGCMANIRAQDIEEALKQAARDKPFLGICIGPQLMMSHSEENGGVDGLGFFAGTVKRFPDNLPADTDNAEQHASGTPFSAAEARLSRRMGEDSTSGTANPCNAEKRASARKIKIPHMGWNTIRQTCAHPLWANIPDHSHYYYVHSYHLPATPYTIGETDYGITFPAAIACDNLAGLQAHPEKSASAGLQILANFANWNP